MRILIKKNGKPEIGFLTIRNSVLGRICKIKLFLVNCCNSLQNKSFNVDTQKQLEVQTVIYMIWQWIENFISQNGKVCDVNFITLFVAIIYGEHGSLCWQEFMLFLWKYLLTLLFLKFIVDLCPRSIFVFLMNKEFFIHFETVI